MLVVMAGVVASSPLSSSSHDINPAALHRQIPVQTEDAIGGTLRDPSYKSASKFTSSAKDSENYSEKSGSLNEPLVDSSNHMNPLTVSSIEHPVASSIPRDFYNPDIVSEADQPDVTENTRYSTTSSYSSATEGSEGRSLESPNIHAQTLSKGELDLNNTEVVDPSSPNVKVTHRISHVEFEVSEVGPGGSTIPAPTHALKPTHPIPLAQTGIALPARDKMAPVFLPKISVNGSPLISTSKPISLKKMEEKLDLTPPRDLIKESSNLRVDSHYSSTVVESAVSSKSTNNIKKLGNSEVSLRSRSDVNNDTVRLNSTSDNEALSSEKSKDKNSQANSVPVTSRIPSILDVASGGSFELLLDKGTEPMSDTSATRDLFEDSQKNINKPVGGGTIGIPLNPLIVPEASSLKTFKREAIDESANNLKQKEISNIFEDYEKEDVSVFANENLSRGPRVYENYRDELEDQKKAEYKKSRSKSKVISDSDSKGSDSSAQTTAPGELVSARSSYSPTVGEPKNITTEKIAITSEYSTPVPDLEDILEEEEEDNSAIFVNSDNSFKLSDLSRPRTSLPLLQESDDTLPIDDQDLHQYYKEISSSRQSNNSEEDLYESGPPTAAAVAEAAILTDLAGDRPKESR